MSYSDVFTTGTFSRLPKREPPADCVGFGEGPIDPKLAEKMKVAGPAEFYNLLFGPVVHIEQKTATEVMLEQRMHEQHERELLRQFGLTPTAPTVTIADQKWDDDVIAGDVDKNRETPEWGDWLVHSTQVIEDIGGELGFLHPEDQVKFLRDVAAFATKLALEVEARNERIGVPDRKQPGQP